MWIIFYQGKNTPFLGYEMQGIVSYTLVNGQEVYKVKFNNGDVVYVSEYGQLIMVRLAGGGGASGEHNNNNEHEDDD